LMNRRSFLTAIFAAPLAGFLPTDRVEWLWVPGHPELLPTAAKLVGNRMITPQEFADQTDEILKRIIDST